MDRTLDVYASTNPAFTSLVLRDFALGCVAVRPAGVEFPLIFLCLPIVLSRRVAATLAQTNRATGLLNWISRNPQILLRFPDRLRQTTLYTRAALRFGILHRLLQVDTGVRLRPLSDGLSRSPRWAAADERGRALLDAHRLGAWLGDIGSPETVFASLGVIP